MINSVNLIKSKYKLVGGGGFYLLIWVWITGLMGLMLNNQSKNTTVVYMIVLLFILQHLILYYLVSINMKKISLSEDSICFRNPIFTFLKQSWKWEEIDYFFTVEENYRFGTFEAVWIIKDGKLIGRFTEFYYANYDELKRNLPIASEGKKNISTIQQLVFRTGFQKIAQN